MKENIRKVALLSLLVLWAQLSLVPWFGIKGIAPDFIFLLFSFFVFFLNRRKVIWWAFGVGLMKDALSNAFFGLETIALVAGVLILNQMVMHFDREDVWVQLWATFISTFSSLLIFLLVFSLVQDEILIGSWHVMKSLMIAGYTALLTPLLFPAFKKYFHLKLRASQYELF